MQVISAENHTVNGERVPIIASSLNTSVWITDLVNGEVYAWRIRAQNDRGFGNYSGVSEEGIPGKFPSLQGIKMKVSLVWHRIPAP